MLKFLAFVFAFVIFPQLAKANADVLPTYKQAEWLNLLHYKNGQSLVNKDSSFFVSKYGNKNPAAEYYTLLSKLKANNVEKITFIVFFLQEVISY